VARPQHTVEPGPGFRASRLIDARYQLINQLGQGGMGSVYRVLDRLTGRVVTLKRLKVDVPDDASRTASEGRMALAREFQVLASLRHPNIISVLDYGFDEDQQPYFTMDLEENASTILEAGEGQPLAVQIELLVQTLRALLYLHRHGVIHRDLKPENIVVVKDQVKVLDFGLSVRRDGASAGGTDWAGTWLYMAPEICAVSRRPSSAASTRSACSRTSSSSACIRPRARRSPSTGPSSTRRCRVPTTRSTRGCGLSSPGSSRSGRTSGTATPRR
jgi:serine/threonine protein kinase